MIRFNQVSSGGNPFGNFNPMTSNNLNSNGMNNFNNAYNVNQPMVEKMDYKNRNNLIHNNVQESTMLEQIIEYFIGIESTDRTLSVYPNPFNFVVTFGGHAQIKESKTFVKKNTNTCGTMNESKYTTKKITYDGTPGPIIDRKFKNIKYIKLDYLIIPKTNVIDMSGSELDISGSACNNYCLSDELKDRFTFKYKYLIAKIYELRSDKILGTNKAIASDTFILFPDKIMGCSHILWYPISTGVRTFKNSNLENLNKLTIEILDPKGNVINVIDKFNNELNVNNIDNEELYNCVNDNLQITVGLIFGVVENEVNTNTNF